MVIFAAIQISFFCSNIFTACFGSCVAFSIYYSLGKTAIGIVSGMTFLEKGTVHSGTKGADKSVLSADDFLRLAKKRHPTVQGVSGVWDKNSIFASYTCAQPKLYEHMQNSITQVFTAEVATDCTLSFARPPKEVLCGIHITVPAHTSVTITDELSASLYTGVGVCVSVGSGARVRYATQRIGNAGAQTRLFFGDVATGGSLTWCEYISYAGTYASSYYTVLMGEYARGETLGVFLGADGDTYALGAQTRHSAARTISDMQSRGVLEETAKTSHESCITMDTVSDGSTGYERQDTLVLSGQAKIYTIPNLDIHAHTVQCSHGASITHVQPEHLFYCTSRGIAPVDARDLFVSGYTAELINRMSIGQTGLPSVH
jgi:hypothetical protein